MLTSLMIRNVVLIDQLCISFHDGFCALTGETGAGKSILLDSLGLALGARADSGLVRKGADQAQVTASFSVAATHPAYVFLQQAGIDAAPDEDLVLRRQLSCDGRSRAFINDQPVSIALLRETGDLLVEIHGQFDTQGLLNAGTHRALLDEYAAIDSKKLASCWQDWQAAEKALAAAHQDIAQARADETYLRQALEDLDALAAEEGEEERLSALRERLMRREQTLESLNQAHTGMDELESVMSGIWRALDKMGDDGAAIQAALDRAHAEFQEAATAMAALSADLENSDFDLPEIDDRLFALRGQARKHNCTVDELPAKRTELSERLSLIEAQDENLAALIKAVDQYKRAYQDQAGRVSKARAAAARKLDDLVGAELPPLKLEKARFVTAIETLPEQEWGAQGCDRVAFQVATNPGSAPGPLHKIASGGEMARFMLALKVVLAETGTAGTLVFDEVDSGIGGSTAAAVGERLARLAQAGKGTARQILVVTHSPQVAARAAGHWIVTKGGDKDVTTQILPLAERTARREEIARMLSGAEISEEARAAAGKLLEAGAA